MTGSYFDNIPPEKVRKIRQRMIKYLRREVPVIYGDLKDEPMGFPEHKSQVLEIWLSGQPTKIDGTRPIASVEKPKYWIWEHELLERFGKYKCSDYDAWRKSHLSSISRTHTVYVMRKDD